MTNNSNDDGIRNKFNTYWYITDLMLSRERPPTNGKVKYKIHTGSSNTTVTIMFRDGVPHNMHGPAVIHGDADEVEWWIDGHRMNNANEFRCLGGWDHDNMLKWFTIHQTIKKKTWLSRLKYWFTN